MEVAGPRAHLISTKIRQFLLRDVCPGNIWKFWNKEHPGAILIPPDVDDTSCIAYLIEPSAFPSHQTRSVLLGNRNSVGLFYTWILPRLGHLCRPQTWIPLYHNLKNPEMPSRSSDWVTISLIRFLQVLLLMPMQYYIWVNHRPRNLPSVGSGR